jgi:UDP-GlcNAc:undecaprenyl-phosphate/decaprenyl-phosphate GlcNAc-1-phosphate transferase
VRGLEPAVTGVVAGAVARLVAPQVISRAPARLARTNISGRTVPAVLAAPLLAGLVAGLAVRPGAAGTSERRLALTAAATAVSMALAGLLDDLRGDEADRGFSGHLRALASGRVTGGTIKMAAGAATGLGAGTALARGAAAWETAALTALTANWLNLLDRAPGRAAKVALALGGAFSLGGAPGSPAAVGALAGALTACLPHDLGERAMLGDAGVNPAGALLGLCLGVSLPRAARLAAIAALAGLTAASEFRSYSAVIAAHPLLARLDALGRSPHESENPARPC